MESLKSPDAEKVNYLKSGGQTIITEAIRERVSGISGTFDEKIGRIFSLVKSIPYNTENKSEVFRKRSADQIISDNYVTGCTDEALVFLALARALGIPAKYIETIDAESLQKASDERGSYNGHIYSGVFEGGKGWQIVDPSRQKKHADPEIDNRIVFREGLDSWDIGIHDFESLKEKFDAIRRK